MSDDPTVWPSDDTLREQGFAIPSGGRKVGSGRVTQNGDGLLELQFATHEDRRAIPDTNAEGEPSD
jgi:hypothetical protein